MKYCLRITFILFIYGFVFVFLPENVLDIWIIELESNLFNSDRDFCLFFCQRMFWTFELVTSNQIYSTHIRIFVCFSLRMCFGHLNYWLRNKFIKLRLGFVFDFLPENVSDIWVIDFESNLLCLYMDLCLFFCQRMFRTFELLTLNQIYSTQIRIFVCFSARECFGHLNYWLRIKFIQLRFFTITNSK